jgi:hypothetical protein
VAEVKLTEIERLRARIARTKKSREQYAYQLAQHSGFSTAASQPLHEVASGSGPLRVTLPGTCGVTITIAASESVPEPEQSVVESSMRSSSFTGGDIAAFTAADYITAIDEMDVEEIMGACEYWGLAVGSDVDVMRAQLRQHYLTMHDDGDAGQAAEVPEDLEETGWTVGCAAASTAASVESSDAAVDVAAQSTDESIVEDPPIILAVGDFSITVEEEDDQVAVPHEAVHAAVAKVYAGMDIERQNAAVAAALNHVEESDDGEELSEVEDDGDVGEDEDEDEDEDEGGMKDADGADAQGANDTQHTVAGVDESDDEEEADAAEVSAEVSDGQEQEVAGDGSPDGDD